MDQRRTRIDRTIARLTADRAHADWARRHDLDAEIAAWRAVRGLIDSPVARRALAALLETRAVPRRCAWCPNRQP